MSILDLIFDIFLLPLLYWNLVKHFNQIIVFFSDEDIDNVPLDVNPDEILAAMDANKAINVTIKNDGLEKQHNREQKQNVTQEKEAKKEKTKKPNLLVQLKNKTDKKGKTE